MDCTKQEHSANRENRKIAEGSLQKLREKITSLESRKTRLKQSIDEGNKAERQCEQAKKALQELYKEWDKRESRRDKVLRKLSFVDCADVYDFLVENRGDSKMCLKYVGDVLRDLEILERFDINKGSSKCRFCQNDEYKMTTKNYKKIRENNELMKVLENRCAAFQRDVDRHKEIMLEQRKEYGNHWKTINARAAEARALKETTLRDWEKVNVELAEAEREEAVLNDELMRIEQKKSTLANTLKVYRTSLKKYRSEIDNLTKNDDDLNEKEATLLKQQKGDRKRKADEKLEREHGKRRDQRNERTVRTPETRAQGKEAVEGDADNEEHGSEPTVMGTSDCSSELFLPKRQIKIEPDEDDSTRRMVKMEPLFMVEPNEDVQRAVKMEPLFATDEDEPPAPVDSGEPTRRIKEEPLDEDCDTALMQQSPVVEPETNMIEPYDECCASAMGETEVPVLDDLPVKEEVEDDDDLDEDDVPLTIDCEQTEEIDGPTVAENEHVAAQNVASPLIDWNYCFNFLKENGFKQVADEHATGLNTSMENAEAEKEKEAEQQEEEEVEEEEVVERVQNEDEGAVMDQEEDSEEVEEGDGEEAVNDDFGIEGVAMTPEKEGEEGGDMEQEQDDDQENETINAVEKNQEENEREDEDGNVEHTQNGNYDVPMEDHNDNLEDPDRKPFQTDNEEEDGAEEGEICDEDEEEEEKSLERRISYGMLVVSPIRGEFTDADAAAASIQPAAKSPRKVKIPSLLDMGTPEKTTTGKQSLADMLLEREKKKSADLEATLKKTRVEKGKLERKVAELRKSVDEEHKDKEKLIDSMKLAQAQLLHDQKLMSGMQTDALKMRECMRRVERERDAAVTQLKAFMAAEEEQRKRAAEYDSMAKANAEFAHLRKQLENQAAGALEMMENERREKEHLRKSVSLLMGEVRTLEEQKEQLEKRSGSTVDTKLEEKLFEKEAELQKSQMMTDALVKGRQSDVETMVRLQMEKCELESLVQHLRNENTLLSRYAQQMDDYRDPRARTRAVDPDELPSRILPDSNFPRSRRH